ncbi:MAG: Fur family transcriptional regulator [Candidatus Pacearchaeota archaeon]
MAETRETRQKKTIEKELTKMRFFFTAEELHRIVLKADRNIGIATVYRFLKDLKKSSKIHAYLCDRKGLYSIKEMNHNHFKCESCGKMEHIKIENLDFVKNFVKGEICHFQVEVSGICTQCKKRNIYK